ncbi:hypothetical protein SHI21_17175 [Bacteriovorax sp. PP10]|uniref:Uncharacterized protein n=1 Tax=Bacteriovorax antarcticus TaxID=3088717 RepID=A0ABU5VY39_9BACT|nr:hypothetical protein [Bacteriovorax sp. PP10]MEA9357967.1 hypothetical protein [Bacteriovorax sp. PP10]
MGLSRFYKFMLSISLSLAFSSVAMAEDANVQTLSEGACWYEQGEFLKIASFNDRESLFISRDDIEEQVSDLLNPSKKKKTLTNDLSLHCGGYGSSLVVKTELDHKPVCLWVKFVKGKLVMRSLGGLEANSSDGDICDGYKWGELIVGVKTLDQKELLQSEHFTSIVKSVSTISGTTLKVTLQPQFHGKEVEAMSELKKQVDLRYIELNLYQHPVGEAASLK